MERRASISFITLNFKSRNFLKTCFDSIIKNSENNDFEIILVNNEGIDLNLSKDIKIINPGNNLGFGKACNLGARSAKGEILCFLNPDAEILTGITRAINYFNENKNTAIIGPKLVTVENKIQEWSTGVETSLWDVIKNNFGIKSSKKIWESQENIEADWVSGTSLFIRKKVFEEVGGFDEKFFMYFEDIDLCKRVKEKKYKVLYFPKLIVKHLGGGSFENKKEQKKYFFSSQDYYFQKHFGKMTSNLLRLIRKLISA